MSGVIATLPKFQFSNALGLPMSGGTLTSYLAGTTTLVTTYQDEALTTANTNPITLDSRGECTIWLDSTKDYKFVLKNALGVTQWTVDDITGAGTLAERLKADLAAPGGSALIGYLPLGTGAVATTVQSKLREGVSVKDFGAVGDGVTDDTAAIQAAFNAGSKIYIPPGTYLVNPIPGLQPTSNTEIVFDPEAKIKAIPQSAGAYQVLMLKNVSNVRLISPTLEGDRASHAGATGEWGHCLAIIACSDIYISNPNISEAWGDGLYVGRVWSANGSTFTTESTLYNERITIDGSTKFHNNRRNGVSVITIDGFYADTIVASKTITGLSPDCGIDIEPNTPSERISNVKIGSIHTSGHKGSGLQIGLRNMNSTTEPVSIEIGSVFSTDDYTCLWATPGDLKGVIQIGLFSILRSGLGGVNFEKLDNAGGMSLSIDRLVVKDCNTTAQASTTFGSAVQIWRNTASTTYPLGNLTIGSLYIDSPASTGGVYFSDASASGQNEGILNIQNIEKINVSAAKLITTGNMQIGFDTGKQAVKSLIAADSSTYTVNLSDYKNLVEGHTTKGTIVVLPVINARRYGVKVKVLMRNAGLSRITPNAADKVLMLGKADGANVDVSQQGALIELQATADGWQVLSCFGSWS